MLAHLNLVPVPAKWLLYLEFECVAASLRHLSTCAWPDRNSLALPDFHLASIGITKSYHLSTCACHPCAEAGCPWVGENARFRAATPPTRDFSNPLRRGASRAVVAVALFLGLPFGIWLFLFLEQAKQPKQSNKSIKPIQWQSWMKSTSQADPFQYRPTTPIKQIICPRLFQPKPI